MNAVAVFIFFVMKKLLDLLDSLCEAGQSNISKLYIRLPLHTCPGAASLILCIDPSPLPVRKSTTSVYSGFSVFLVNHFFEAQHSFWLTGESPDCRFGSEIGKHERALGSVLK